MLTRAWDWGSEGALRDNEESFLVGEADLVRFRPSRDVGDPSIGSKGLAVASAEL